MKIKETNNFKETHSSMSLVRQFYCKYIVKKTFLFSPFMNI